ncbi:Uncharacterised protein [Helicobacter mustelae]|uniref:DUF3972 domain-containing protein n=1 Tax=Helicobacter mustelae TaxID=217 RepID=UPI000E02C7AD|nr:DUF3972 domain-containing protein [Helicobacter mustelae]STP12257.1 Uncharacterised protein [Helicobacter mustelae]
MAQISLQEFLAATHLKEQEILESLTPTLIQDIPHIPIKKGIELFLQRIESQLVAMDMNSHVLEPMFFEQTLQALSFLYEKLLSQTQNEDVIKENTLLKETLLSLQEEAQKKDQSLDLLLQEIKNRDEEIAFLKRKHQLMWGKIGNMGIIKES